MTPKNNINCHFVTRSLTQPWELENRRLKYFDFSLDRIDEADSKTLFALENLNSGEVESRLNKLVEEPISRFKMDLLKSDDPASIGRWATYRALWLYFLIQAPRFAKISLIGEKQEADFDRILSKDESYLDMLVQARQEDNHIRIFRLPEGNVMVFPQIGYFAFPVEDAGCVTGFT